MHHRSTGGAATITAATTGAPTTTTVTTAGVARTAGAINATGRLAIDACNNSNTCSQIVTVVDTTPPDLVCATNKTVECGAVWDFDEPSVSDTCSGTNVTLVILDTVTNGVCPQFFTRTWQATDACGNTNVCSQIVTVADTTPPDLVCATNKTVECGAMWDFDEPSVSDTCSGTNVTLSVLGTRTNTVYPLVVSRSWLATDACGNTNTCEQTVTTMDSGPLIVLCPANKVLYCGTNWNFDLPTVTRGECGSNVTITLLDTVTNSLCPESLTRTWGITNLLNNEAALCAQTVTVYCPDCPIIVVTKDCPPNPVPPGGILNFTGTVTNVSELTLTNVIVLNEHPVPDTLVFGPAVLAPGQSAAFAGSYTVSAADCGPYLDTLTVFGTAPDGLVFSNSIAVACPRATVSTPGDLNGDGVVDQTELDAVLVNYWPYSPWLYLTNTAGLGGTNVLFSLSNSTAGAFSVEYTTNLRDWTHLGPATPRYEFTDTNAPAQPQRFYRLRWP